MDASLDLRTLEHSLLCTRVSARRLDREATHKRIHIRVQSRQRLNVRTEAIAWRPSLLHFSSAFSGKRRDSRVIECVKSELVFPRNGRRPNINS